MKTIIIPILTSLVLGVPNELTCRQERRGGKVGEPEISPFHGFTSGGCKSSIFFYARGATEPSPIVRTVNIYLKYDCKLRLGIRVCLLQSL